MTSAPALLPSPVAAGPDPRERWRHQVRAALAFSLVLFCVYQTSVLTDLTDDVIRLGIEADSYEMLWVSVSWACTFLLGVFAAIPFMARFGNRLTLVVGLAAFALGNLLSGMSVSLETMVAARAVEGIGKGMATVAGRSGLYKQFDRSMLFAVGFYGVFAYSSRYCSPMIAATLNDELSWRWIYWVNVPLALLGLVAVLLAFRPDRPAAPRIIPLDWPSIALALGWFSALIMTLGWYRRWGGWGSNRFAFVAVLDVALPALLVARLSSGSGPNDHLERLVRSRVYIGAMMVRGLMLVHMSAVLSIMGTYLVEMRGYPRPLAGWIMVPASLTMALTTTLTLVFHRRSLRHAWLFVAVVGGSACLWWISSIDNYTPKATLATMLAAWGLFLGLFCPVFLIDEVEGQNRKDAAFAAAFSIVVLFGLMVIVPTVTKVSIQAWSDRAEDTMRLNIRANRPAVEATTARVADYYRRGGLPSSDASSAAGHLIGEYVVRESIIQGLQWGLQFLSLVLLALGLPVATVLARAARTLKAPPDSGYT